MTSNLVFGSNSLSLFFYEPFSYRWTFPSNTVASKSTVTTSTSVGGSITKDSSGVTFANAAGCNVFSSFETIVIQAYDSASNLLGVSSNTLTIDYGRFVDDVSASLTGRRFTFYRNEPITPTVFSAAFPLKSAPVPNNISPSLPAGVSFVFDTSSRYILQGTPSLQAPLANYGIVGSNSNASKTAQTSVSIVVNAERLILDPSGIGVVDQMQVGTPITPTTLTARCPPYPRQAPNLCNIQYTWTPLPGGLEFANSSGVPQSSPFVPTDASATLILQGTPTLAGAKQFAALNISQATVGVTANRIGSTSVAASKQFLVSFGETVLFDDIPSFRFYKDVPLDPSANFVRARTYFAPLDVSITDIVDLGLPPGLSLNFVQPEARAYITGTPTTVGIASYTFRATNANGSNQDTATTIEVVADSVTLTPPADVSYTFILSRPLTNSFTSYYTSPISWTATVASKEPVTFSAPALAGTGLSLSVSGNTATLSGIPDTVTLPQTLQVTASAAVTGASASSDVSFSIIDDVFTFAAVDLSTLTFVQNRAITPVQFSATTLSERAVVSYSSSNLPSGLTVSAGGLLTGTPLTDTSGSFTLVASTGYTRGSNTYSYSLIPDTILFLVNPNQYSYAPGATVSVDLDGVAFSGGVVSNYAFSNLSPTYGMSVDSGSGIISGTLYNDTIPNQILPAFDSFSVTASAGLRTTALGAQLASTNPLYNRAYLLVDPITGTSNGGTSGPTSLYTTNDASLTPWLPEAFGQTVDTWVTDFVIKNTSPISNFYVAPRCILTDSTSGIWRSSNGFSFDLTLDAFPPVVSIYQTRPYKVINIPNTTTWYASGSANDGYVPYAALFVSTSAGAGSNDEAQNWTLVGGDKIVTQEGNTMMARVPISASNAYVAWGTALGYSGGVFMMGGAYDSNLMPPPGGGSAPSDTMIRSDVSGTRWNSITNPLRLEVANFELDGPVWVATGSSDYRTTQTFPSGPLAGPITTVVYSTDQGQTWTGATGTLPDIFAYEVAYASNTWLATGWTQGTMGGGFWNIKSRVSYSTDGSNWGEVTLPVTFTQYDATNRTFNFFPEAAALWFDDSSASWNILVKMLNSNTLDYRCILYTHDLNSSLSNGWTERVSALANLDGVADVSVRGLARQYTRVFPTNSNTALLSFSNLAANGPVLVSPTQRSYTFYQHTRIPTLTLSATGTGTVSYFVQQSQLPDGIQFDPLTATFSGKAVTLGTSVVDVYLADTIGITKVSFTFFTTIPTITRQQTSASAYTSFVRQYTVVNAARNAENNEVYPSEVTTIGEFARPVPPNEITATVDPKCYSTSNCT